MRKQLLKNSTEFEEFAEKWFHGGKPNAYSTPESYPTVILHQQFHGSVDTYDFVYPSDFPKQAQPKPQKAASLPQSGTS